MLIRKKTRLRGASPVNRDPPKKSPLLQFSHSVKNWHMLITGFIVGICATVFCKNYIFKSTNYLITPVQSVQLTTSIQHDKVYIADLPAANQKPVFDFYTQLSDIKSIPVSAGDALLSDTDHKASPAQVNNKTLKNTHTGIIPKNHKEANDQSVVLAENKENIRKMLKTETTKLNINTSKYLVQAASMKKMDSAQLLQKKLKIWGIDTQINTAKNQDGSQWHSVQAGPFFSLESAKNVLNILATHNLKGLLIKQSDIITK